MEFVIEALFELFVEDLFLSHIVGSFSITISEYEHIQKLTIGDMRDFLYAKSLSHCFVAV